VHLHSKRSPLSGLERSSRLTIIFAAENRCLEAHSTNDGQAGAKKQGLLRTSPSATTAAVELSACPSLLPARHIHNISVAATTQCTWV
jgi:hypothetical protein